MSDASVSLAEHVGHQVMVTGRMDSPATSVAPSFVRVGAVEQRLELERQRGQGRVHDGDQGQHDLGHLQHRLVTSSRSTPARSGAGVEVDEEAAHEQHASVAAGNRRRRRRSAVRSCRRSWTRTTSREVVSAAGCVQQASAAEATAGGQRIDGAFVLRGARIGGTSGRAERPALPPTSPGTPASSEGSEATNTAEPGSGAPPAEARASGNDMASTRPRDAGLLLVADRGVDLAAHVGHRVMVSGRLSSFAAPAAWPRRHRDAR